MNESDIVSYFSGLSATIKSTKEVQKLYDPLIAFNFNSINFLRPGENKYSEILAFFLNPKEVHGQGYLFLNIFLKNIALDSKVTASDITNIECECEHVIADNHRRIDLLITFGKNEFAIAIENKVWARDQENQLQDYNLYLENHFKNYCLLYLTPYQNEPSKESINSASYSELTEKGLLKLIGYTDHIISCVHDWATTCKADRVRVFLLDFEQYLKKEFLGQTFMEENEIIANHALKSSENIEVAFATANALNEIKRTLIDQFKLQIKEIAAANNLEIDEIIENLAFNEPYTGFSLYKKTWEYVNITFQFESKNANDFKYGLSLIGEDDGKNPIKISAEFLTPILGKFNKSKDKNEWWVFFDYFKDNYRNWNNQSQPWIDIQNGKMKQKIDSIIKDFIEIIGDLNL